MPHFCQDELLMLMAAIPIIGMYFNKIHLWYHNKFKHHSHKDHV